MNSSVPLEEANRPGSSTGIATSGTKSDAKDELQASFESMPELHDSKVILALSLKPIVD
jgi:hypothetical protein